MCDLFSKVLSLLFALLQLLLNCGVVLVNYFEFHTGALSRLSTGIICTVVLFGLTSLSELVKVCFCNHLGACIVSQTSVTQEEEENGYSPIG